MSESGSLDDLLSTMKRLLALADGTPAVLATQRPKDIRLAAEALDTLILNAERPAVTTVLGLPIVYDRAVPPGFVEIRNRNGDRLDLILFAA
jgi:hypothetical protein